ncbi:MAG: aminoglycoside phosphotransferase family protein [Polyangiaceae bacterium]
MNRLEVLSFVKEVTGTAHAEFGRKIQSLWGGYGELLRVEVAGPSGTPTSVVVKWAKPPQRSASPDEEVSRARKCRSYEVEAAFYRTYAPQCDDACRTAKLHGSKRNSATEQEWTLVLEDLDAAGFSRRVRSPRGEALNACLRWLAAFHARFLGKAPKDLWRVGTYWHLATRTEELANVRDAALREAAPELDRRLRQARFQTFVHGDAKPANFCFSNDERRVAAVDFQYVGGGPGIKDVAYLLEGMPKAEESRALAFYFAALRAALPDGSNEVEQEWRGLYDTAADDFRRFLAGWRG